MRVLSISHLFPNKCNPNKGVFVKERLKSISKQIDLSIIAPVSYFPFMRLLPRYEYLDKLTFKENIDGLDIIHPRYLVVPGILKFTDGYLFYLSMNKFITNIIREKRFHLLDFQWGYPDAFAGFLWSKKLGKKIILTIRGNESICYFEKSFRKKMMFNILNKFDHIITVSTDLKDKVVKNCFVDDAKVTVIPNGIDHTKFYLMDKKEAQKKCNLDPHKKYILSLSRLSPEKGLEHLLTAFSNIRQLNVELILVGEGPLKNTLTRIADNLKIKDKLKFIGEIQHDETCVWYNAVDVFCLPSLWEGCPNVIIESLSCGTPVVSTRVGGVPDLIQSDECGFMVSPGDDFALLKALERALIHDWNRHKVCRIGGKNSWDHVASKVISVYEKVIS